MKIRKGVFETNSSSTHALVVGSKLDTDDLPSDVVLTGGEYGWYGEDLVTVLDKANYLLTMINSVYSIPSVDYSFKAGLATVEDFENTVKKNKYYTEMLKNCLEKRLGYIEIEYNEDSYIDHGDAWISDLPDIFKNLDKILFNRDSYIVLSNDNGGTDSEKWEETVNKPNVYIKYG